MDDEHSLSIGHSDSIDSDSLLEAFGCSVSWLTFAFSVLGVFTNAISIHIYTHRVMRSPVNVLLAGLSAIDLVLSACFIPSFVVPMWFQCYRLESLERAQNYFTIYVYPFAMMAQTASIFTFLVIAFDRWIAVCQPLKARWFTIKRSYRALMVVTLSAIGYNVVRFFEYRLVSDPEHNRTQLQLVLKNDTLYPAYMPIYYVASYLITHFLIPFTILINVNILMILSIIKARHQSVMLGRKQKREHKTTIMMGMVVLVFVLTNTLPFVLNFVEAVSPDYFYDDETSLIGFALLDLGNLLIVINISTTAFIYYACSQRYRRLFLYKCHTLFCGFKWCPFETCSKIRSDFAAINGGYSLTNGHASSVHHAIFRVGPTGSICTIPIGHFLPNRYRAVMAKCRSTSIPSNGSRQGSLDTLNSLRGEPV